MAKLKFARYTASVGVPGNPTTFIVEEGEAWDADDPVVLHNPHAFSDEPEQVHSSFGTRTVEQATAAPGERRKR